jgi:hypothetical protein
MPYRKEDLQNLLATSASELQNDEKQRLVRLQANVQILHNPKRLSIPGQPHDGQAHSYGAAVRQVTDSQNQTAFLVLTLIGFSN